jgi:hypothetical protein
MHTGLATVDRVRETPASRLLTPIFDAVPVQ